MEELKKAGHLMIAKPAKLTVKQRAILKRKSKRTPVQKF